MLFKSILVVAAIISTLVLGGGVERQKKRLVLAGMMT